jgi:predicted transcriptional regulator
MTFFQECSQPLVGRAILLSVKPKYSDLIVSGEKRVEFRRRWAAEEIDHIAVYASAPIQRIVALVSVDEVIWASRTKLWGHCTSKGGALTRRELNAYFMGRGQGCAVMLGEVRKLEQPLDPRSVFKKFSAPQSFRYLTEVEIKKLEKSAISQKVYA